MATPSWRRRTVRAEWLAFALLLGAAVSHGCAPGGAYACTSDAACTAAGSEGVCQETGYCSFPSEECDSGQRYGEHAPVGLASSCVPASAGGDSGSGGSAGTSLEPSITTASGDESTSESTEGALPADTGDATTTTTLDTGDEGASTVDIGSSSGEGTSTGTALTCGDGVIDGDEECDAQDLGGYTCTDVAFTGGTLGCSGSCELDPTQCLGCGVPLVAAGAPACPAECTSCDGATCTIACVGDEACKEDERDCPDGWDCDVVCDGFEACHKLELDGPSIERLTVTCTGVRACKDTKVDCGHGLCEMTCGTDSEVCTGGTKLRCGEQACTAICAGAPEPDVECEGACACTECG